MAHALNMRADGALEDGDFDRLRRLLYELAGIHLSDAKRALMLGRLSRRLRLLNLRTFGEYYQKLTAGDDAARVERQLFVDAMTTNETHFFREEGHWAFLEQHVFPALRGGPPRTVRAWSAACSTGEEPYTLAMAASEALPRDEGWDVRILGTDISTRVLERARAAQWPMARADEIPPCLLRRHMLRGEGTQTGQMKAGRHLRDMVTIRPLNLKEPPYDVEGPFDLIFCRNVMIYFDREMKRKVVDALVRHLRPDGYLFVGHAESLTGLTDSLQVITPTVYRLRSPIP